MWTLIFQAVSYKICLPSFVIASVIPQNMVSLNCITAWICGDKFTVCFYSEARVNGHNILLYMDWHSLRADLMGAFFLLRIFHHLRMPHKQFWQYFYIWFELYIQIVGTFRRRLISEFRPFISFDLWFCWTW